jgi:hypothetical protein
MGSTGTRHDNKWQNMTGSSEASLKRVFHDRAAAHKPKITNAQCQASAGVV